jgi:vanillate O-demethylase monooxygenase subunit
MTPPFELGHWHPILLDRDLGSRPKRVTLHGQDLVVFRTSTGLGALDDTCPHRRARLSDGRVVADRLVCPYHGFRFDKAGLGESPGTPTVRAACRSWQVALAWDAIWVRLDLGAQVPHDLTPGASPTHKAPPLPTLGRPGFRHIGTLVHDVAAPLEPLVDNFCEVEHTPTTHALFGYREDALATLDVRWSADDTTVRVQNRGPQKPIPALVSRLFGVRGGDTFIDDWVVHFSPVHIVYDQGWEHPETGAPIADAVHLGVFFVPIDRDETRLVTVLFSNRAPSRLPGVDALVQQILRGIVDREVRLDQRQVERLADPSPDLRGTRLGRFDAPLREHRKRIDRLYRGRPA